MQIINLLKDNARSFRNAIRFNHDFRDFKRLSKGKHRFLLDSRDKTCFYESIQGFDRHYIFHTAWAARILRQLKPQCHVDISSSLYFVGICSAFIPIKFYDYRPPNLRLSELSVESADILDLPFADQSVFSMSCMHVIEHIGLGRYGDPLDPEADLKAIKELKRVIAPGGHLLFVVPIGKPKIIFNAHRIYSFEQIKSYFEDFKLTEYALIPDNSTDGSLLLNPPQSISDSQNYACGCFWFSRND